MSVPISIRDFCRMPHMSAEALRHYHELGLLEPAEVDPSSDIRMYDLGQVPLAQAIRRLRDEGVPIDRVRDTLLPAADGQVPADDGPVPPAAIEYRTAGRELALAFTGTVKVADFNDWWVTAFTHLRECVEGFGLTRIGPDSALYPDEFFELEEAEVVSYIPVSLMDIASHPSIVEVPGAELAVLVHHGSYADTDRTYAALGAAVAIGGLRAGRQSGGGPIREHYLTGPLDGADEEDWRTEICWPVPDPGGDRRLSL